MKLPAEPARTLLRKAAVGALGTHSAAEPGFPYVTAMPFALDADGAPIFLVSGLAEHTRNLQADARASLLVQADGGADAALASARLTLIGHARRCEPDDALVARYLRYQPDAERYLALGDFVFFRFAILRGRMIGGFGSMGWLEAPAFAPPLAWDGAQEAQVLARVAALFPPAVRVLGADCEGLDLLRDTARVRLPFAAACAPEAAFDAAQAAWRAAGGAPA